jgi:hypothetical protein
MNHNVLFLEKKGQQVINYNFIGINIKQAFWQKYGLSITLTTYEGIQL